MKACPFCAELIQERAVKCRFCGEWLDPSARPSWSTDAPPPAAAPIVASERSPQPAPESPAREPDPSPATTATDGSTTRPLRSWSTPPWLAEREGSTPVANLPGRGSAPTPTPIGMAASGEIGSTGTVVASPVATASGTLVSAAASARSRERVHAAEPRRIDPDERLPEPTLRPADAAEPARVAAKAARPASPPDRASLEEVALQMERLGQGAAAMRGAVERGPEPRAAWDEPAFPSHPRPAPVVHDDDDDDFDARSSAPPADPALPLHDWDDPYADDALPRPREAGGVEDAFLGDLDADDGGHDDWGDADPGFGGMAPAARPLPWVPILAGAAILVVVGAFAFRDALFGGTASEDAIAAESSEAADGGGEPKAEGADAKAGESEAKAAEVGGDAKAEGADTKAEGDAKAEAGDTKAEAGDAGTAAAPPQPVKLDAATLARLDEARGLYTKADGRNTKLLKEAGTILDEVLKVAPQHPEALLLKAQVLLESGDMQAALATAQRCTAASAELADCWLTIGVVQQENKEKDLALQAYERYLALAPEGKYAKDVGRQVKKLKR